MPNCNEGKLITTPVIRRNPNLTMGERFKDVRIDHNQNGKETIDRVAKAVGTSKSTLSDIENDRRDPGAEIITKLARHYGVSSDYLLGLSDVITPDATAQSVIDYTGLSEDNVATLHHMKENSSQPILPNVGNDESMGINGCKPYLDFLNDILDAVYSKKDTIIRDYILMQYYSVFIGNYDPQFFSEDIETVLPAHGQTSVPISAFIEHTSIRIAREIEKYLIDKYAAKEVGDE